jgi:hypothetical protein
MFRGVKGPCCMMDQLQAINEEPLLYRDRAEGSNPLLLSQCFYMKLEGVSEIANRLRDP